MKDDPLGSWMNDAPSGKQPTEAERHSKDIENLRHITEATERTEKLKTQRATGASLFSKVSPAEILLEVAMSSDTSVVLNYLVEPWLPHKQVIGFYGRGGTAKSSFVATLATMIAQHSSTLWISTEEDVSWIKVRHVRAGGGDGTLYVYKALVTKQDALGRAEASTFNVYEHLEAAIINAKVQTAANAPNFADRNERPLRFVVLDTAVALTTWAKGESPNDDKSVKRLTAYLRELCDKFDVTIAVIGHVNKGNHDYLADMVAGSGAWTTSLRQAFMHVYDQREEYNYVACTVKDTLTGPFAGTYKTYPVHTLATRIDGSDSVLCAVKFHELEWGYQNVRALVDLATVKERDEGEGGGQHRSSPKEMQISSIVNTVARLLGEGCPKLDRGMVTEALGYSPHRRHWIDADIALSIRHNILTTRGAHGVIFYEMKK